MIRANQTDLKMEKLRGNPVEIYVMRFSSETTPGPAYIEALCRGGAVMHDNWFEADWYDTPEEVESNIAESARSVYSAERIRINVGSDTIQSHINAICELTNTCEDTGELRSAILPMIQAVSDIRCRISDLEEDTETKEARARGAEAVKLLKEHGIGYVICMYNPFNQEDSEYMYVNDISELDGLLSLKGIVIDKSPDVGPNIKMCEERIEIADVRVFSKSLDGSFTIRMDGHTRREYQVNPPGSSVYSYAIQAMNDAVDIFKNLPR